MAPSSRSGRSADGLAGPPHVIVGQGDERVGLPVVRSVAVPYDANRKGLKGRRSWRVTTDDWQQSYRPM